MNELVGTVELFPFLEVSAIARRVTLRILALAFHSDIAAPRFAEALQYRPRMDIGVVARVVLERGPILSSAALTLRFHGTYDSGLGPRWDLTMVD